MSLVNRITQVPVRELQLALDEVEAEKLVQGRTAATPYKAVSREQNSLNDVKSGPDEL